MKRHVKLRLFLLGIVLLLGFISYRLAKDMAFYTDDASAPAAAPSQEQQSCNPALDPSALANTPAWSTMTARLEESAHKFPARIGIYLKDLKTGKEWAYHADNIFPSASLVKVPIMIALFSKIKAGEVSLSEQLTLKKGEKLGGSGTLRRLRYGTKFTVRELTEKMINDSDNTATKMIINRLGIDYLQKAFPTFGLQYTNIGPDGLNLDNGVVQYENYTTPREMAMMFEKIYRGEMIDRESSSTMLSILKRTRHLSRFAKTLPSGWQLAHKTGMLRLSCHDAGIIFSPRGAYVLAVSTWDVPDYHYAANYISRLAAITYRTYGAGGSDDSRPARTRSSRRRRA